MSVSAAYERYYETGAYDRRYPRPNPVVLGTVRRHAPVARPRIADVGCGSGRYSLALAPGSERIVGYDLSANALARAEAARRRAGEERVTFADPGAFEAGSHIRDHGTADVALALFGVIAHIPGRAERHGLLTELWHALRPGTGRLIISVPNRARRFRREQKASGDGACVHYTRACNGETIELVYHLYTPQRLCNDLRAAGFEVVRVKAESVMPERVVAGSRLVRVLERLITPVVPARWGYGLLAVARRPAEEAASG